jgi:pyruvate formate lyase activating enzyme
LVRRSARRVLVSHVQRFCLEDGPGIRTTAFVQGCPLRCWWCHNPEARPARAEGAVAWSPRELAVYLARDLRFFRASGGGVTLSGGEPLAQAEAVAVLLRALGRAGVHRCVETSGAGDPDAVLRLAPHVDLWLWDVKSIDPVRYAEGTGADVALPLGNLARVLETAATVRVRVSLIRGFNDDDGQVERIADWLSARSRRSPVEVLAGHDLCVRAVRPATVTAARVSEVAALLASRGLDVVEGGG